MAEMEVQYFTQGTAGTVEKNASGNYVVKDLPIFKTGSFKDNRGNLTTWTADQLDEAVTNFARLRENGALVHVPLRSDHTRATADLIGYVDDVRLDGEQLVGDLEFTEPDHYDKWQRGTYRSRSLEIGSFETNDGSLYWPVVKGCAFVDIPAVEGLFSKSDGPQPQESKTKEPDPMPDDPKQLHQFTMKGVPTTDYASVQKHIDELEGQEPPELPENHSFKVYGEDQKDYSKVQEHIDVLEGGLVEMAMQTREDFIKEQSKQNKLPAPQIDSTIEFAKSLSPEQWEQYRKNFEEAPKAPPAAPTGQHKSEHDDDKSTLSEKDILEERVAMFKRGGMTDDKIKDTDTFKRLETLKASQ